MQKVPHPHLGKSYTHSANETGFTQIVNLLLEITKGGPDLEDTTRHRLQEMERLEISTVEKNTEYARQKELARNIDMDTVLLYTNKSKSESGTTSNA